MKRFLPLAFDISDGPVLVVGGGKAALHKLKTLALYDARIRLVAPRILPEAEGLAEEVHRRGYLTSDLEGVLLVYAATDDSRLNHLISGEAAERGIPCNVCDDPAYSRFVSPAIEKRGRISVAVSSNGEDVRESLRIRERIREVLSDDPA